MDDAFREPPYPFAAHLGMSMDAWGEDHARFTLPIAPHLGNRHGNPHGGAHAALLDTAMGYAGCWTGDPDRPRYCLTLTLTVHYLSRPKGAHFIAEGRRIGGGRSTFFAEGTVTDDAGHLVATGSGTFRYRSGA